MKSAIIASLTLCCTVLHLAMASDQAFIVLAPRVMLQGSDNKIECSFLNLEDPGELELRLVKTDNETVFVTQTYQIEAGNTKTFLTFSIPEIEDYEAKLRVSGKFGEYEIFGEDTVTFRRANSKLIFIQTDKPIYKPGQKVMFRVLLVDSQLKPLGRNSEIDMWVEEPSGSRIAQWKNASIGYGLIQRELQLSDEPILGNWRIVASVNGLQESITFEEKEYVLPKFEVTIKPPSYVLVTAKQIPVEVCGKYTYGKKVEGTVKINTTLETYSWSYDKFPTIQYEGEIEGCYKYEINVTSIDEDLSYVYRRIKVFAEITETGTGISRNESKYIDRIQNPLNLRFESDSRQYFKPGLPYHGELKVTNPDDSVAAEEPIEICVTISRERVLSEWWATRKVKYCRNYTSDENGLVSYTVPPQNIDAVSISIEAKSMKYITTQGSSNPTIYQPQTSTYLRPWFSPSGSHIQVRSQRGPLPCGETANIQVLYTAKDKQNFKCYYEVVSNGKVIVSDSLDVDFQKDDDVSKDNCDDVTLEAKEIQLVPPPSPETDESRDEDDDNNCKAIKEARYVPLVGLVNISVAVSADTSPSFHFLVYYVLPGGEVVADSQKFSVEKCFNNKVELKFGEEVKQPGTKTTLTLSSSPNSLCGIKVVDKSITLLDSSEQLTIKKVFEALERNNVGQYYPRNHCYGKKVQPGLEKSFASRTIIKPPYPPRPWSSSTYEDALTAFENVGYAVISDLILLTRPCKNNNNQNYEAHAAIAMPSMGVRGAAFAAPANRRPVAVNKVAFTESFDAPARGAAEADTATKSVVDVRTLFPDTWLFDLVNVGEDGEVIKKEQLPHTITEWLGSAVCINEDDGLGLTSKTAHIRGFQAFFLSFTLPYSVVRGEKLPVIVSVFNYLDKCLPVSIQFEQTNGFVLLSDSSQVDVCVCGGKSKSMEFTIQPTVLGTLNLTVSGRNAEESDVCNELDVATVVARDAITNPLLVEAEGFPYEKVTNALFCPKDVENDVYEETFSFELPEDVVEDSARGYLSISGDIMGPTIENLDRLVQLPTGCGEQNMVTFTPITFVLNYLQTTGKLKDSLKSKGIQYLNSGYQREMKYRRNDNSYSAFGSRDKEGSMWLTAFVLRSFAQAKPYISIDDNIQKSARDWIVSKQRDDGSFPEIGVILSHGIKGGLNASSTALTAYVLSSLLIGDFAPSNVTEAALAFMASEDEDKMDAYKAILFAYTFALAGEDATAKIYLKYALDKAETTGEETHWRIKGSTSSAASIEIASYAVLTLLKLGEPMKESLPMIRGITKRRTSHGGFSSTQDTVLALQALSEFAIVMNKEPVNLEVTLSGDLTEKTSFDEDDKILVKKFKTPDVPAEVKVEASGSGCGLIQATVLCNTLTPQKKGIFELEVEADQSEDCKTINIKVCTRYVPNGKKSNMALVEVKMISGVVPRKESLEALLNKSGLELKRYDMENNNGVFYFDEITNEKKCFEFTADQVVAVGDVKPATSKVYDYYDTEQKQETTYTIKGSCN